MATVPLLDESGVEAVPALGTVIAEKYRIDGLIARGGMGAVYLATHLVSGKRVALKWMLPTLGQVHGAKERFVREACATARIDHPNVVDIYDVGNDRGSVYLVMELLRGETLAEYLQRTTQVAAPEAVALLMPALRGVAAAHAHGVIHRDLKPENIFLCRSAEGEPREPRVLDFGISKITDGDERDLALTRSGAVMGTPYYMSPEQVRGAKEVDERGDVYAFGVMLYEMLTGQRPFDAETYNHLILKIATETPAPIATLNPGVDARLVAVVERAMAREPTGRYQNIEELAAALEPFAAGVTFRASLVRTHAPAADSGEHLLGTAAAARADSRPHAAARRSKGSRSFVALGVALGCALAGLAFWLLSRSESEPGPTSLAIAPEHPNPRPQADAPASETALSAVTRQPDPAEPQPAASGSNDPSVSATSASEPAAIRPSAAALPLAEAPALQPAGVQPSRRPAHPQSSAQLEHGRAAKRPEPAPAVANRPAAASGAAAEPTLPDDWDEHLRVAPRARPASATPVSPAGPLDMSDLR